MYAYTSYNFSYGRRNIYSVLLRWHGNPSCLPGLDQCQLGTSALPLPTLNAGLAHHPDPKLLSGWYPKSQVSSSVSWQRKLEVSLTCSSLLESLQNGTGGQQAPWALALCRLRAEGERGVVGRAHHYLTTFYMSMPTLWSSWNIVPGR